MKTNYFLIWVFLLSPFILCAQFPAFTNFEGKSFYEDNNPENEKYRAIFSLENKIDSELANDFAKELETKIQTLNTEIQKTRSNDAISASEKNKLVIKINDSISFLKEARNYFSSINKFTGNPTLAAGIFPVTKPKYSRFFYQATGEKDVDFLSNFILQSNLEKTAISSDLITGSISIFQFILSTTVTDNSEAENQEVLSNKLLYGALLNGEVNVPIFFQANEHFALYIPLSFKASIDHLAINEINSTKETFHFGEISSSLYLRIPYRHTKYKNNISFFANGNLAWIGGGSRFYDKIGDFRNSFLLCQSTVGVEINNRLRIAMNIPIFSSEDYIMENTAPTFGVQIDPKLLSK